MSLTKEQQCVYQQLLEAETDLFYLSPRDCKQLAKGLSRIGVKTPEQLRDWFQALLEADQ